MRTTLQGDAQQQITFCHNLVNDETIGLIMHAGENLAMVHNVRIRFVKCFFSWSGP